MRAEAIAVLTHGIERAPSANLYLYRAQLRPAAELAERRSDLAKACRWSHNPSASRAIVRNWKSAPVISAMPSPSSPRS
jgi:hypothetical protein